MTLEEVLQQMMNCYYDDVECNQCVTEAINYLAELKEWRDNPFKKMSEVCREKPSCKACDYDEFCCGRTGATVPEEWKF